MTRPNSPETRPATAAGATRTVVRGSLYYVLFFMILGTMLPFWPVWLASTGLGATEIAVIFAVMMFSRALAAPVTSHIADRLGSRRRLMALLIFASFIAFLFFPLADGFFATLIVALIFSLLWNGVGPLGENTVLLALKQRDLDYARVRLWGSLSFMAAAVGIGTFVERFGEDVVFWVVAATFAGLVLFSPFLLEPRTQPAVHRLPAGYLLSQKPFLLFLGAAALIQVSHGFYYTFGTLNWRAVGLSDGFIGWLWALAVAAEIALFAVYGKTAARSDPARLLLFAAGVAVIRWPLTAVIIDPVALIAVQCLHAVTFGITHLATMNYIVRFVRPDMSATAMALHAAVANGVGMGLVSLSSGPLFETFGAQGYHAMILIAGAGGLCAWGLHKSRVWETP